MNILRKNWVVMLVGGLVLVGALRLLAAEGINRASPAPVEVKPMPEVSEFKPAPIDLYDADPQHLWNLLH